MFFVYVLESSLNKSYYIGSCSNIHQRLSMHNKRLVKSTKRYAPWQLIYCEQYSTLIQSRAREKQLKSWKKRAAVDRLIKTFQNLSEIEDPR